MIKLLTDPLFWFFALPAIVAALLGVSLLWHGSAYSYQLTAKSRSPIYLACSDCGAPLDRGPVPLEGLMPSGATSLSWFGPPCRHCGCCKRAWRRVPFYRIHLAISQISDLLRRRRARPGRGPRRQVYVAGVASGKHLTTGDKVALCILVPIALYFFVECAPAILSAVYSSQFTVLSQ